MSVRGKYRCDGRDKWKKRGELRFETRMKLSKIPQAQCWVFYSVKLFVRLEKIVPVKLGELFWPCSEEFDNFSVLI